MCKWQKWVGKFGLWTLIWTNQKGALIGWNFISQWGKKYQDSHFTIQTWPNHLLWKFKETFEYLVCNFLLRNWHPSRPGSTHFSSIAKFLPIQNLFLHKINSFLMFSGCRALVKNPFCSKIPIDIVEKRDWKQKYGKEPSLAHYKFEQCCHFFIYLLQT